MFLFIVPGLTFLLVGTLTVVGAPAIVHNFTHLGYPHWFRRLIGTLEALGGAGVLLGPVIFPPLLPLATLGLAGVMLGAVVSHLRVRDPLPRVLVPAALLVLLAIATAHAWLALRGPGLA
jgi:hypothetical protein